MRLSKIVPTLPWLANDGANFNHISIQNGFILLTNPGLRQTCLGALDEHREEKGW